MFTNDFNILTSMLSDSGIHYDVQLGMLTKIPMVFVPQVTNAKFAACYDTENDSFNGYDLIHNADYMHVNAGDILDAILFACYPDKEDYEETCLFDVR
jgi:hypothetical protein